MSDQTLDDKLKDLEAKNRELEARLAANTSGHSYADPPPQQETPMGRLRRALLEKHGHSEEAAERLTGPFGAAASFLYAGRQDPGLLRALAEEVRLTQEWADKFTSGG